MATSLRPVFNDLNSIFKKAEDYSGPEKYSESIFTGIIPCKIQSVSDCINKYTLVDAWACNLQNSLDTLCHTVLIGKDFSNNWIVFCSDPFLEGRMDLLDIDPSIEQALATCGLSPKEAQSVNKRLNEEGHLTNLFSVTGVPDTFCSYPLRFLESQSVDTPFCNHIKYVLVNHRKQIEAYFSKPSLFAELIPSLAAPVSSASSGLDSIDLIIEENAGLMPLMLLGETGSRKTYRARSFARRHGLPLVELGGNNDVRPIDLTGHYVQNPAMGTVWKDGKFSQAMRRAQKEKTVFLFDEIYTLEPENLSILLTSLSVSDDGCYYHSTGRIVDIVDGVGSEEVLKVPQSNLIIIATSNLGAQYGVIQRNPALRRRFLEIEVPCTSDTIKFVTEEILLKKGFDVSLSAKFCKLWQDTKASKEQGLLQEQANVGIFARAIEHSKSEADIKKRLLLEVLQWAGTDLSGEPDRNHINNAKKLIGACFG